MDMGLGVMAGFTLGVAILIGLFLFVSILSE
jgi:hypothetical protein